jgi:hypothetical protein
MGGEYHRRLAPAFEENLLAEGPAWFRGLAMNDDNSYRVYILRHQTPRSHGAFLGMDEDDFNLSALEPSLEFLSHLVENIPEYGELIPGPGKDTDEGIVTEHVVCLIKPWPEMWELPQVSPRVAGGEIFESASGIYYLQQNLAMRLEGQVLADWFDGEHGRRVPDLDAQLSRRLRRSCRLECRSMGYNGAAMREIMPRWIETVWTKVPREWTWNWLRQELMRSVDEFQKTLGQGRVWYVYEQLQSDDVYIPSPFADGSMVTEVIEAAVDDLPGVRQWLVQASPLFGFMRSRIPELETVRRMEEYEIFCSRRGALWIRDGHGVHLGEVTQEIVAGRHGEIVPDLSEQARRTALDLVLAEIEKEVASAPFDEIIDLIHAAIDEANPLEMWHKSVPEIASRVLENNGFW